MKGSHGWLIKIGIEPRMTTEEIAKEIGVSRAVIQRIERRAIKKLLTYLHTRQIELRDLINE